MQPIAILADPHFHDTGIEAGEPGRPTGFRTFADSAASTRLFNESGPALRAALDDIAARGIKLVVIAGDLTDDGQAVTLVSAIGLLEDYARRYGMRFFMTPGNHDLYALAGRHQTKRFLNRDGSYALVTSDPAQEDEGATHRIVTDGVHCHGYADALAGMARLGFFRQQHDLHWESPFGSSDALTDRTYKASSRDGRTICDMVDASYLVEPVPGLWLLSIDANVFVPRNGASNLVDEASFHDSTDAGWDELVRHKPHLLGWMADVARRAEQSGKRLVVFSHYPAVDPLNGTLAEEKSLFGNTSFARRTPDPETARIVAETGIKVHFSGHLHVNDTGIYRQEHDFLVNVAVPSLVAFAPAYKLVAFEGAMMKIETVSVYEVPDFDAAFSHYAQEAVKEGISYGRPLEARGYGTFVSLHLEQLTNWRYLTREWPKDMAELLPQLSLGDLWRRVGDEPSPVQLEGLGFFDLIADWYRLRKASQLALDFISSERLDAYCRLAEHYGCAGINGERTEIWVKQFLGMFLRYLNGPPSRHFSIDLENGKVEETDYRGLTDLRQTGTA